MDQISSLAFDFIPRGRCNPGEFKDRNRKVQVLLQKRDIYFLCRSTKRIDGGVFRFRRTGLVSVSHVSEL